jgi:uncharacterized protein YpmB
MKKLFKIIGSIILILIIAVVVFLYFRVLHYRKDNKEAEALTDKIQAAINQTAWDSTAAVSLALEEITIISDKKRNLVQVEWDDKKVLYNTQTIEGIAYENGKKLTDSENRCYKKRE